MLSFHKDTAKVIGDGLLQYSHEVRSLVQVTPPYHVSSDIMDARHCIELFSICRSCDRLPEVAHVCRCSWWEFPHRRRNQKGYADAYLNLTYVGGRSATMPVVDVLRKMEQFVVQYEMEINGQRGIEERLLDAGCERIVNWQNCRIFNTSFVCSFNTPFLNARAYKVTAANSNMETGVILFSPFFTAQGMLMIGAFRSIPVMGRVGTPTTRTFNTLTFDKALMETIKAL